MKEYYEVNYNGNYYNGKIGVKIDEGSYTITLAFPEVSVFEGGLVCFYKEQVEFYDRC